MTTPIWTEENKNEVLNEVIFNQLGVEFNQAGITFGGSTNTIWTLTNKNT